MSDYNFGPYYHEGVGPLRSIRLTTTILEWSPIIMQSMPIRNVTMPLVTDDLRAAAGKIYGC